MLNLPIFNLKKLRLAFEYGLTLAKTAQEMGVELTPEIVARAEVMLENEFKHQTASFCATNIVPNIMTAFELDVRK